MYVEMYCYSSAPIDPTLVHTQLKIFSHSYNYKVMDINVKKYGCQMQTNNLNDQLIHLHTHITSMNMCAKPEHTKTKKMWPVIQFTEQ